MMAIPSVGEAAGRGRPKVAREHSRKSESATYTAPLLYRYYTVTTPSLYRHYTVTIPLRISAHQVGERRHITEEYGGEEGSEDDLKRGG